MLLAYEGVFRDHTVRQVARTAPEDDPQCYTSGRGKSRPGGRGSDRSAGRGRSPNQSLELSLGCRRPARDELFNIAVLIDDDRQGDRDLIRREQLLDGRDAALVNWIVHRNFLEEVLNARIRIGANVQPDQIDSALGERSMQAVEFGHLFHARNAPRRPQVDERTTAGMNQAAQV